MLKKIFISKLYIVIFLILSGCSGIPISYYDSTTYKQLTGLKVETTSLIESFDEKLYSENKEKIETVTLDLEKAYEYEKGKGEANNDTAKQFKKILGLYRENIDEYKEHGPRDLGEKYFSEAAVVLGQAFDIAISTENSKNKDKR